MIKTELSVFLFLLTCSGAFGSPFEDGHKHYFTYSATSHVLGLHNLTTIIKFHVLPVNISEDGCMNLLKLDSFVQRSSQGYVASNPKHWDLSRSFLFHVTGSGVVSKIFHHSNEEHEVLTLKKLLAGTLSMYKKRSHLDNWKYKGWETDHHGKLLHSYTGRRVAGGTTFTRQHNSSEHVNRLHEKTINYDHKGLITSVKSKESIRLRNKPGPPESVKRDENVVIISTENGDFPSITSTSDNSVKLTARRRFSSYVHEDYSSLKSDSPEIRKAVKQQQLKNVEQDLERILACIKSYPDKYSANRTQCAHELIRLYNNLTREDRLLLAERHLPRCQSGDTVCEDERSIFLDIVCGRGDKDSQELVLKYILHDGNATEDEIRTVLYHYINLKEPIKETVDVVEDLCFKDDYQMAHTEELADNQMRACLTLGGLVQWLSTNGNHTHAQEVVMKLEKKLGMYNHTLSMPIVNRGKRSIYNFDEEQHNHVVTKMVLIHSLGNAGMSRSLRHIRSYLEPNKGSPAWRRAAANSLRYFKCNESALALFDILAHETNEKVHNEAREVYLKHPRRRDLMDEKEAIVLSRRYDYHTVTRIKREVFELHSTPDGLGFQMLIQAPELHKERTIGTSNIGANIGIRLTNYLKLKLHPLNSFFRVNIDNRAWIRADVGMINVHVDIASAKFCFVGHIEYNLNVLKEFSIDHFKDLLNKLNDMIHKITSDVKEAMTLFKKITSPDYIKKLFTTFIDFVKNLPNLVVQFVQDFIKLVKKVIHYHADPIIEKVKQIGMRIKAFAEEVKQDALEFYHSIADAVMITLPNVGKMLAEAGDDIISVFKDFFKSPTQSFSKLEQVVIRVQLAVSMILDAKNRIMDACFFTKGTSPYWMRLSDDISVIIGDIKDLAHMVMTKVNNIIQPGAQKGALPQPDNNGIMGPYDLKSWFHEETHVMLSNATTSVSELKTVADPFFQTFHEVMTLIKDVKTAYEMVNTVIHVSKSVIQRLFGGKFHKKFPSEKEGSTCTDAVWPSNGKGKFKTAGVDVTAYSQQTIVNPVTGTVKISKYPNEIIILPTDRHFRKYVIILNNVSPLSNITHKERLIEAGEPIGKAGDLHCAPNFVHVAMYVRHTHMSVDPTKYLHRNTPLPKWETVCNERSLTILDMTHEIGSMSKRPEDEIDDYKTAHYGSMAKLTDVELKIASPFRPKGIDNKTTKHLATIFADKLYNLTDVGEMVMSLKNKTPHIQDVFDINTMAVTKLKEKLKSKPEMVKQLDDLVHDVASCIKEVPVINPAGMSLFKLRSLTEFFQLNGTGDRLAMVTSLRRNALKDCPNLNTSVSYEFGHYCTAHFDCQGMTCGAVFEYAQYLKTIQIDIRRCGQNIIISLQNKTVSIDVNLGYHTFDAMLPDTIMDGIFVTFHVEIEEENGDAIVALSGSLCATNFGTCLPQVLIFVYASFPNNTCSPDGATDPFVDRINAMPVRRLMSKVSQCHLDMTQALAMLNNIRDAVLSQLFDSGNQKVETFIEEFSGKKDSCIRMPFPSHPKDMTFFILKVHFMVGPIPMVLEFGAGGRSGNTIQLDACFMSMEITGKIIPMAALKIWGQLDIDIGIAFGGLELVGYIMQISFPVAGTIGFAKFPLDRETLQPSSETLQSRFYRTWLARSFKKFYGRHSEEFTKYDMSLINTMRDAIPYFDLFGEFSDLLNHLSSLW